MSECDPETHNNANNNRLHQERFGKRHKQCRTRTGIPFQSTSNKKKNKLAE